MHATTALVLVLFALFPTRPLANPAPVLELSQFNFDKHAATGTLLVEFYAPWCSHCRRFEQSYSEVAEQLSNSGVSVARVDGSDNRILAQRFRVAGFPSFFLINDRTVTEFVGPRSVENLVRFATSRGKRLGRKQSRALGPFHIYWRAVAAVLSGAEKAALFVDESPRNKSFAVAISVVTVGAVIAMFATFVHFVTKPPPRPHAE